MRERERERERERDRERKRQTDRQCFAKFSWYYISVPYSWVSYD
jgi:hypothetical protein